MREIRSFHAPGRVNLIGEHTDHTDGLVLPAAIDRGITLRVELGGPDIRLTSADAPEAVLVPADGSSGPPSGWGRFVAGVAAELAASGRAAVGMRGTLSSDLPREAGLASSAALEVVVALALNEAAQFEMAPLELVAACRRAEHRAVGVPSGILDQAASIMGCAGHALFLDCATLEHRVVKLPSDLALLVVNSGVRRSLEDSGYAQRTRELTAALPILDGRRPADVAPDELANLVPALGPVAARRLRHVVTENARVRATERALNAGDLAAVGELFEAGHASLRDDFEVTTPELDSLVRLARESGAVAARMTGGGFGGSIVALVPVERSTRVGREVLERYAELHADRSASALVCRPSDGARQLS